MFRRSSDLVAAVTQIARVGFISLDTLRPTVPFSTFSDIVRVRKWDEGAKDPSVTTPSFADYAQLLQRVVDRHMATTQQ